MTSYHVVVVVVLAMAGGVAADYLGYNITSTAATSDGYTSIILEGLPLAIEVVTGFYVNMAAANCPIKLQIWRRIAYLKYTILYERNFTSTTRGKVLVPLEESEEFIITTGDKLGFSSLSPDSSCVAFTESPGNRSETLSYTYSSGIPPVQGPTYVFDSYKDTHLFGIGIQVKYGLHDSRLFVLAGDTKVFGYNVSQSTNLAKVGRLSILLEGLRLTEGKLTGYHVHLAHPDCPVKLQIWRPTTGRRYLLLGETDFSSPTAGYFFVPTASPLSVSVSDKLGFTTLDEAMSCVPYLFVSDGRRSQTLFYGFADGPPPHVDSVYDFNSLQTTFLFGVEVVIEEAVLLLPGPTGAAGATGPQGPQGVKGVAGDTGDTGDQGLTGDTGPQGDEGHHGNRGLKGPEGNQGPLGDTGIQGLEGSTGVGGKVGSVGPVGEDGDTGSTGDKGIQGVNGPDGKKGPVGITGEPGSPGDSQKGDNGTEGAVGVEGHTGPQGMTGETGTLGIEGIPGAIGPAGSTGVQGPMWTPVDFCKSPNVKCEHICESDGITAVCSCRKGYQLVEKHRCLDINECDTKNGLCQYDCINTEGSFHCACPPGLLLSKDNHRCNDIDECQETPSPCATDQVCINMWGEFHCAGPWREAEEKSVFSSLTDVMFDVPLVTRHVVIGLVLWLVLLSLLMVMAIILLIPELAESRQTPPREPTAPRGTRAEFYYPAFFPRIILDRRASADKLDIADSVTPRRMSRDEANVAQEEMFSHVNRGASVADTERKRSEL